MPGKSLAEQIKKLQEISLHGRQIAEAADEPIDWLWRPYLVTGTLALFGGDPGSGKTTLVFLAMAQRARTRVSEVLFLGAPLKTAPPGKYIVIVEGEHRPSSAARKLRRVIHQLGLHEEEAEIFDRVYLVTQKSVTVGDSHWTNILALVKAGLVSDVVLDTLASTTHTTDSNKEQDQVKLFGDLANAIRESPNQNSLTLWLLAHMRKKSGGASEVGLGLQDVAGSVQRTGQVDTVGIVEHRKSSKGSSRYAVLNFVKLREEPTDLNEEVRTEIGYRLRGTLELVGLDGKPLRVVPAASVSRATQGPPADPAELFLEVFAAQGGAPITRRQLRDLVGGRPKTINDLIQEALKAGKIEVLTIDASGNVTEAFRLKNVT